MPWNWELPDWPNFYYDKDSIFQEERLFLLNLGSASAHLKNVGIQEHHQYVVEILSQEGLESSRIEGEILDRDSLQSSIKKHFNLNVNNKRESYKESGMAEVLCNLYDTYAKPLTHEMLWDWHSKLFPYQSQIDDRGRYRTHLEPMQIVSGRHDQHKVFFEAPPSARIPHEMSQFIDWYNSMPPSDPILGKAALAHVYFESIHPFEDGNGRIGRLLIEKICSQSVGSPVLIAISKVLEKRKREYYEALERCNKTLNAQHWVKFFAEIALQAQQDSIELLYFLIKKSKILTALSGKINVRQEKALLRMFSEGPSGFRGGLSAEKYIAITKASRATATRDLNDLVEKGALIKTGELRHTRYWFVTSVGRRTS